MDENLTLLLSSCLREAEGDQMTGLTVLMTIYACSTIAPADCGNYPMVSEKRMDAAEVAKLSLQIIESFKKSNPELTVQNWTFGSFENGEDS